MSPPIPGRECGDCAMCCKLPEIPPLQKPTNQWCQHCTNHRNCSAYETRPQICRDFFCVFMSNPNMGEEWRPSKARFMVTADEDGKTIQVFVDSSRPDAWRKEPFLTTFRQWSETFRVIVIMDQHHQVIFPTHIVDLGMVMKEDSITFFTEQTAHGPRLSAMRVTPAQG